MTTGETQPEQPDEKNIRPWSFDIAGDDIVRHWHAEQAGWTEDGAGATEAARILYDGSDVPLEFIQARVDTARITFIMDHGLFDTPDPADWPPDLAAAWRKRFSFVGGDRLEVPAPAPHPLDPVKGLLAPALFEAQMTEVTTSDQQADEEISTRLLELIGINYEGGLNQKQYRETTTLIFQASVGEQLCGDCETIGRDASNPRNFAVKELDVCKDHLRLKVVYEPPNSRGSKLIRRALKFLDTGENTA